MEEPSIPYGEFPEEESINEEELQRLIETEFPGEEIIEQAIEEALEEKGLTRPEAEQIIGDIEEVLEAPPPPPPLPPIEEKKQKTTQSQLDTIIDLLEAIKDKLNVGLISTSSYIPSSSSKSRFQVEEESIKKLTPEEKAKIQKKREATVVSYADVIKQLQQGVKLKPVKKGSGYKRNIKKRVRRVRFCD